MIQEVRFALPHSSRRLVTAFARWDSQAERQISSAPRSRELRYRPMKMHFKFFLALLGMALTTVPVCAETVPDALVQFTASELRADFTAMYQGLQSAAYNLYAFTPKAELDRAYRHTLAGLNNAMTLFKAQIRFEEFASRIHMGHARVNFPYAVWTQYLTDGGKAFPFAIRVVGGKTFVAQNQSGMGAIARGDEILKLNGSPMRTWLRRAERHVSAETPYMAHSLMEFDFPTYVWVELGEVAGFDLALRKSDGKTLKVRVPARTSSEMKAFAAAQPPPLALDNPMREAKILADNVAYLRPGPFYNADARTGADQWDVSGFRTFVDGAFDKFNAAHADRLIIDLRGNPGGDNLFSDVMIAWFADKPFRFFSQFNVRVSPESTKANADRLQNDAEAAGPVSRQYAEMYAHAKPGDVVDFEMPLVEPRKDERYRGKVFLLIDRQSYSNSVAVAALVQDYKFGKVLGEETSDMATTYGAMEQFKLSKTGITVGYPKAHIVRPNGDLRARGVRPDIAIRIPPVETPADEVLQRAVAIARESQ
jgi:C-terminal processing protease CtpA/Prc